MSSKIVVTGLGIITAIGNNIEESYHSLVNQKSGIGPINVLQTIHKDNFVLGEVKKSHDELIKMADVDPQKPWTRTSLLGIIAARQAFLDSGLDKNNDHKIGLVSATTVGGMDRSELHYTSFVRDAVFNPYIDTHHAGDSTEKIADQLKIKDYLTTISTACSSSLNSIMFGARLIKNGIVDKVIAGGTDGLSKFTLNGFNTLMILDKDQCRPFDASRRGLNLGEGAAYIVLEREENAKAESKKIYATLSGYANANDAFHQTASSEEGDGPFLAMKNALDKGNISPEDVDYINVHGTGTDNNDLTEGRALIRLFGDKLPPFSSTKAYTGHTLGAAGSVESIISILSLQKNTMFPNINFKEVINEIGIRPISKVEKTELQHVLTNSFGFGGNDSSLLFSKYVGS